MPEKQRHNLSELLSDLNNIFFQTIAKALTTKSSPPVTISQADMINIEKQTFKKIAGLVAELKTVNSKTTDASGEEIAFLLESLVNSSSSDPKKVFESIGMIQTLPNDIRSKIMEKFNTSMKNTNAGIVEKTPEEVSKIELLKKVSDMSPIDNVEALNMNLVSNISHKLYFTPLPNKKVINGVQVMTFQKYFTKMKSRIQNPIPMVIQPFPVNVGVVYLTGTIARHTDKVVRALLEAASDNSVKAIVLRVDSGGGDVTVSDQIAETVDYIQTKLHIPVVASYASVAASGGVYATAGCELIIGNQTTITGSIGVASIQPLLPKEKLLEYGIGIEELEMSKSAKNSSLFNRMDKEGEERKREQIENIYDRFKYKVSKGREMSLDEVEKVAQGQVFTGQRAIKHKLVDSIGKKGINSRIVLGCY
jgi:protease IV